MWPTDVADKTSICRKQDTDRNMTVRFTTITSRWWREVSEKPWKNSHCCLCLLEVVEQRSNWTYSLCFLDLCYSFYVWSEVLVMHFWSNRKWHQKSAITETSSTHSMKHSPWYKRSQGSPSPAQLVLVWVGTWTGLTSSHTEKAQLTEEKWGLQQNLGKPSHNRRICLNFHRSSNSRCFWLVMRHGVSPSPWSSTLVSLSNFFPRKEKVIY